MHFISYINFAQWSPMPFRAHVDPVLQFLGSKNDPNFLKLSSSHLSFYSVGSRDLSWSKRPEREVDHSSPSSTKYNNELSYTSAPPICLYCADSDSFTLSYIYLHSVWEVADRFFREFFHALPVSKHVPW